MTTSQTLKKHKKNSLSHVSVVRLKIQKIISILRSRTEIHTRLMVREMDLKNYLFNTDIYDIPPKERLRITESLRREMIEIYSGMNIYG